jgi:LysR family nitrogen assimilation transcriptional regulator
LDLRELRYFLSVGRTGNFGRAARELNISQPTITNQVLKLEEGLGTRLLIRHGRGVTLTRAGSCLMERIETIMGLLNAPLDQAPAPEQTVGTISLGLPFEAAPTLVPHLLRVCGEQWPGVTLTVREGSSATLEEWVLERRVDLALLQDPPALDGLEIEPVASQRLGLVTGVRGQDDKSEGAIGIRSLIGRQLILPSQRHWIRRVVEGAAFRRGVGLDKVRQVDGVLLTKEMVRDGLGVTVLPLAAVQDDVARGVLTFRAFEREPLGAVHAIASHFGAELAPFLSAVRDLTRDTIRGLADRNIWADVAVTATRTGKSGRRLMEGASPG